MKHTPGPWKAGVTESGSPAVLLENSGQPHPSGGIYLPVPICRTGEGRRDAEEVAANARLIAAAPELLAACEELIAYELGMRGGLSACVRLAQAAIAKVKQS